MSECQEDKRCPKCGTEMIEGFLHDALEIVHVKSYKSLRASSLKAWICSACGYVELEATAPRRLDREDVPDLPSEEDDPGAGNEGIA
jgi:ribosomal protein S27AE